MYQQTVCADTKSQFSLDGSGGAKAFSSAAQVSAVCVWEILAFLLT